MKYLALVLVCILALPLAASAEKIPEGIEHITDGAKPVTFMHRTIVRETPEA